MDISTKRPEGVSPVLTLTNGIPAFLLRNHVSRVVLTEP